MKDEGLRFVLLVSVLVAAMMAAMLTMANILLAEEVRAKVVYVEDGAELCPAFVPEVMRTVGKILSDNIGIDLRVTKIVNRANSCPMARPAECWAEALRVRPDVVTVVIAPPLLKATHAYYAGWAYVASYGLRPLAVAQCGGGIRACAVVVAHEMLHTLGAVHTGGRCNLMHWNALGCGSLALRVSPRTKRQVLNFMGEL